MSYVLLLVLVVVYPLHTQIAGSGKVYNPADAEKSYVNAKMLECWKKNNLASVFLPVVHCLSPALAFWHQGSVWYCWSQYSPALTSYDF